MPQITLAGLENWLPVVAALWVISVLALIYAARRYFASQALARSVGAPATVQPFIGENPHDALAEQDPFHPFIGDDLYVPTGRDNVADFVITEPFVTASPTLAEQLGRRAKREEPTVSQFAAPKVPLSQPWIQRPKREESPTPQVTALQQPSPEPSAPHGKQEGTRTPDVTALPPLAERGPSITQEEPPTSHVTAPPLSLPQTSSETAKQEEPPTPLVTAPPLAVPHTSSERANLEEPPTPNVTAPPLSLPQTSSASAEHDEPLTPHVTAPPPSLPQTSSERAELDDPPTPHVTAPPLPQSSSERAEQEDRPTPGATSETQPAKPEVSVLDAVRARFAEEGTPAQGLSDLIRALYLDESNFTFHSIADLSDDDRALARRLIDHWLADPLALDRWEEIYTAVPKSYALIRDREPAAGDAWRSHS